MSPIVRYAVYTAILLLISFKVRSQLFNLEFDHYNTDKGLSQNEVFDVVQDQQGFIWIGTDEGLNRFDGHEFKVFRYEENNPNSIISNSIQALEIDRNGTLWIGTQNGLSRYYPDTERMERLPFDYNDPSKPNGISVTDMIIHKDGTIWISYLGDGVDVYFPEKNEFLHYNSNNADQYKIRNNYVTALLPLPNNEKLLGTREGVFVIGENGIPLTDDECLRKYPWKTKVDNSVTCFRLSRNEKTLWIGTELKGFYEVDLRTDSVRNFTTANSRLSFNNNVPSLLEDSNGNLWVGGEAIHLMDRVTKVLYPYNENGVQENITKNPILSIYEDRHQNIWLGTFRLGVLKYNSVKNQVAHFYSRQGEGSIGNDQVLSFNEDESGNIWIGTDGGGLYQLKPHSKRFVHAPTDRFSATQVIKCIYRDPKGIFWMGTWDGGFIKFDPATGQGESFNPDKKNFNSRHVWDIMPDSVGNLWIGTLRDGLCYFNPKTKQYKYYTNITDDPTSLVNNDIMCLKTDSDGTIWIATSNGISVLRKGSDKFVNYRSEEYPNLNLNILSVWEDDKNRMWFGTSGGGIFITDHDFKLIRIIGEKNGLASNTICSLQPDDHGNIWAGTYNGLFRISTDDFVISEVPQYIGLQGREFIPRSSFKSRDGRLLFGGVNGFNIFHPDSLELSHDNVKVVFTSLKVLNDEVLPDSLYHGKKIIGQSITQAPEVYLTYGDYSFTLTFSPLLYTWQNSLRYEYRLEGLDKDWQPLSSASRSIHYTNLASGNYTLRVKASYDGKYWSSEMATLVIRMAPAWWTTFWFRVAVALLGAAVLLGIYKLRIRFLTQQKTKLQGLVATRTSELEMSNRKLWEKNEEIQTLLEELAEQNNDIESKNQELSMINEQISVQRDVLAIRSVELEKAQDRLKEINMNLEQLIQRRTQKLNHTLRELETFLYRASHDLRGPISSMLGLLRVAALEGNQSRTDQKYVEYFQKTILKLERTLQKLMQKHTIQKSRVTPVVITKSSLEHIFQTITKDLDYFRPHDFRVNIQDDFAFETDTTMVMIILTNLIENAFFFSERSTNPVVDIDVIQKNSEAMISILDHGPGIKHDIRDKIFTMFFRGHESATGNGLGLYLVRDALLKINGKITVETEEGVYSRFTVILEKVSDPAPVNAVE